MSKYHNTQQNKTEAIRFSKCPHSILILSRVYLQPPESETSISLIESVTLVSFLLAVLARRSAILVSVHWHETHQLSPSLPQRRSYQNDRGRPMLLINLRNTNTVHLYWKNSIGFPLNNKLNLKGIVFAINHLWFWFLPWISVWTCRGLYSFKISSFCLRHSHLWHTSIQFVREGGGVQYFERTALWPISILWSVHSADVISLDVSCENYGCSKNYSWVFLTSSK